MSSIDGTAGGFSDRCAYRGASRISSEVPAFVGSAQFKYASAKLERLACSGAAKICPLTVIAGAWSQRPRHGQRPTLTFLRPSAADSIRRYSFSAPFKKHGSAV